MNVYNENEEIWREIEGFEGLYEISNKGNVKNHKTGTLIKTRKNVKSGYVQVDIRKNKKKYTKYVHRLVAIAFVKNEFKKPQVNHIDEDKNNNEAMNLEWCTCKENINHATHNFRAGRSSSEARNNYSKSSKEVLGINITSGLILQFPSTRECKRHGFNQGSVSACCLNKRNKHKNFKWCYI